MVDEREEIFQARLEQLETGQPVEACLVGLGEEDAAAFRLIASMRAAAYPEQNPALVASYREQALHRARQAGQTSAPKRTTREPGIWERLQEQLDWLLTRRALAGVMVALFIGACLLVSGITAIRLATGGSDEEIASSGDGTDAGKTPSPGEETDNNPVQGSNIPRETLAAADQLFLPFMFQPVVSNPTTAMIQGVRGRVEVQAADGTWTPVLALGQLTAGQRVRTGNFSSATVVYFDGSQATLGANSELLLDELNAQRPEDGFRTVVMTQVAGESEHHVAFRNDGGSRYEVKTAAGNGVARGTIFHVLVTPDLRARFTVNEGRVDVSNLNSTVSVLAGQLSQTMAGRAPTTPAYRISGEGLVTQMGTTWIIAGQSFQTDATTLIDAGIQVGDMVHVEGQHTSDGVRQANHIILLQPSNNNQFSLVGEVETMGDTTWTVAGQTLVVNAETQIETGIAVGDRVRVEGEVLPGGALLAEEIFRLEGGNGFPFRFTGVVQDISATSWVISGQVVAVDEDTRIDEGIAVGDVVRVRGRILSGNLWLAERIRLVSQTTPEFSLTGLVQSLDPWNVAGVSFETRDWTVIEPGIAIGDLVRVRGIILDDGTWVAVSIESLENPPLNVIVLIGIVTGMEPWSINGFPLVVTNATIIGPGITVGTWVITHIQLQPDGSWVTLSIQPLRPQFGLGCLIITAVVVQVSGNQVILQNWEPLVLGENIEIQGNIQPNSTILFPICTWPNGTIIVIQIIVIYQPVIIIVPPPGNPGGNGNGNGNDND